MDKVRLESGINDHLEMRKSWARERRNGLLMRAFEWLTLLTALTMLPILSVMIALKLFSA